MQQSTTAVAKSIRKAHMRTGRVSALAAASVMTVGALVGVSGAGTASATSYETIKIKSWDGYCLSISTATVGTRLDQVPCADAHNWWLTPGYDLYPEGHANVQVGDSGGYLKLKTARTGTAPHRPQGGGALSRKCQPASMIEAANAFCAPSVSPRRRGATSDHKPHSGRPSAECRRVCSASQSPQVRVHKSSSEHLRSDPAHLRSS